MWRELVSDLLWVPDFPAPGVGASEFARLVPVGADGVRHGAIDTAERAGPAPDAVAGGAAGAGCRVSRDAGGGVSAIGAAGGRTASFKHENSPREERPRRAAGAGCRVRPWGWP